MTIDYQFSETAADFQLIERHLMAYNARFLTEKHDYTTIKALDADGALLGGISFAVFGRCCYIALLWMGENARGRGVGGELLARAEAEARRRGCSYMRLNTHSFQAPGFYPKFGYQLAAEWADYPQIGYTNREFRKELA
ncbi:hypothetical protein SDC9_70656 [bioreactor metagenome]|uniref:N-acetyltransferase domain-containing protein n=1 Tax=bioreactor metagenome TaxID=1076179 RepID=A0A644Y6J2_9ZZZZ